MHHKTRIGIMKDEEKYYTVKWCFRLLECFDIVVHYSQIEMRYLFSLVFTKTDMRLPNSRAWRWVRVLATQLRCASLVRATTPGCCCCLRIDTQFSAVGAAKNSHPSFCPPSSDFGCSPNILFGAGVGIS